MCPIVVPIVVSLQVCKVISIDFNCVFITFGKLSELRIVNGAETLQL